MENKMLQRIQDFVALFNARVDDADIKARRAGCFAMIGLLEEAISLAAKGDRAAMSTARAYARATLDMGAERVLTQDYLFDYIHVAKLLTTPGEVPNNPLAFEGLDDILSIRVSSPPTSDLH